MEQLFPSKLASGKAFCNRVLEREQLLLNIREVRHSLLISPRRYGKTSLAMQVLNEAGCAYAYINLFNALRDEFVAKKFIIGFNGLLNMVMPNPQKALKKVGQVFKKLRLILEVKGIKASLNIKSETSDPIETIRALLEDIENLLISENKFAVVFLDEFQDIIKTDMSDLLQAELRDFAQRTKHVAFIISGSYRHMLGKIFDDRNKPFYKLFERINLERIATKDYTSFLQKLAQHKWKASLDEATVAQIILLSENHPYYLNRICAKLWNLPSIPTPEKVTLAWENLADEEFDSVVNDISLLSKNQRILLQALAEDGYLSEPNSTTAIEKLKMAHSSISQALEVLVQYDFVEKTEAGYQIIDPLLKFILSRE